MPRRTQRQILDTDGMDAKRYQPPIGKPVFVLQDMETTLYRSRELFDSKFAWVRPIAAAARFATRRSAVAVATAYSKGRDEVANYAAASPDPQEVIYPQPFIEAGRKYQAGHGC